MKISLDNVSISKTRMHDAVHIKLCFVMNLPQAVGSLAHFICYIKSHHDWLLYIGYSRCRKLQMCKWTINITVQYLTDTHTICIGVYDESIQFLLSIEITLEAHMVLLGTVVNYIQYSWSVLTFNPFWGSAILAIRTIYLYCLYY